MHVRLQFQVSTAPLVRSACDPVCRMGGLRGGSTISGPRLLGCGNRVACLVSQRYLVAAHDSVSNLIDQSYPALRATRPGGRGRLTQAESDLFRTVVVFAGAGVDAVLKQATRDCMGVLVTSR